MLKYHQQYRLQGSFEQRLAQRKEERKIVLNENDSKRLGTQCVTGQAGIRKLQQETTALSQERVTTYRKIDAKLWVAVGRLKLAGSDTFKLEKSRSDLAQRVAQFQTTLATYQQTLDDVVVVNCKADVVGFKALLETARLYYAQLRSQSAAINASVVNDIKPTLAEYAADLKPKQEGNN